MSDMAKLGRIVKGEEVRVPHVNVDWGTYISMEELNAYIHDTPVLWKLLHDVNLLPGLCSKDSLEWHRCYKIANAWRQNELSEAKKRLDEEDD